jgi:CelD/BcsL family acetyltransferase involved in cellulose biosynthesis
MRRASPALDSPFLAPGFTLAVGRVRPGARVAVLEDGQDVVGFFPYEVGRLRIGRPIGAGVSDVQGVIHVPGLEWNARELLRGCRLDVWEFDHLIGSQIGRTGERVARVPSPIIDVSSGYEAYIAERQRTSRKVIKSTLYKERRLERDVGAVHLEFDSHDPHALTTLMKWKSNQYRRTGRRDQFAVSWIRALVWDLFETQSDGCTGTLSVLHAPDRVVAAHFGLRSESWLACWFPTYDPVLARHSPGLALHLRMAAAAASAGISHLDLGKGDELYKQSLKTADLTVGEGRIHQESLASIVHKIQGTPSDWATSIVLSNPRLRRTVRRALKQVGTLRRPL